MTEPLSIDNEKEAQEVKSGIWIALAVLVINGAILWFFNISDMLKIASLVVMAALLPLLVWVAVHQKHLAAVVDEAGIKFKERLGNELIIRNEIGYSEVERVVLVEEGRKFVWCRIMPRNGKGILLGNFNDKSLHILNHFREAIPEKVFTAKLDAAEKAEKRKCDCLL